MEKRFSSEAGIAIGVILFALAIIAVISVAMSAGSNFAGTTIATDRVAAEVKSQALLLTTKIRECYNHGLSAKQAECDNNTLLSDGSWSRSGCNPIDKTSYYPTSTGTGTAITSVTCPSFDASSNNLWTGQAPLLLPATPAGMDTWYYVNAGDSGGRCIRIAPSTANLTNAAIKQGLIEASSAFSSQELTFDSAGASLRFIIWLTRPTGTASADCSS